MKSLKNVDGFRRRTLCLSLALSSVVGAIGGAGLRKKVGLLRLGLHGPKVLRHQMVRWCAGGTEYPKLWHRHTVNHWHRQWGRHQFCIQFSDNVVMGARYWRFILKQEWQTVNVTASLTSRNKNYTGPWSTCLLDCDKRDIVARNGFEIIQTYIWWICAHEVRWGGGALL